MHKYYKYISFTLYYVLCITFNSSKRLCNLSKNIVIFLIAYASHGGQPTWGEKRGSRTLQPGLKVQRVQMKIKGHFL